MKRVSWVRVGSLLALVPATVFGGLGSSAWPFFVLLGGDRPLRRRKS
jgi:hypothetical protein